MHSKPVLFGTLAILTLVGCAPTPRIISADNQGVTYRVKADSQAAARSAAAEYCKTRGREAQLNNVTAASNNRSILSFVCS